MKLQNIILSFQCRYVSLNLMMTGNVYSFCNLTIRFMRLIILFRLKHKLYFNLICRIFKTTNEINLIIVLNNLLF